MITDTELKNRLNQTIDDLTQEYVLKANYPNEDGETWDWENIHALIGEFDLLCDLLGLADDGLYISAIEYRAENQHLDPFTQDINLDRVYREFNREIGRYRESFS